MLLPLVDRVAEDVASGFPQHELFGHATDLLCDRLGSDDFYDVVIEKWNSALDRVSHFHAIAQHRQNIIGQHGLCPKVKSLVERVALGELAIDVEITEQGAKTFALAIAIKKVIRKQRPHFLGPR